jgi:mono/diheme cytochrome c family protein
MRKILVNFLLLLLLIVFVITELACSNNGRIAASEMTHGEKLYRARCGNCHRLRAPHENTTEEWALNVEKYGKRMTAEQRQLVLDYLLSARREGT